MLTTVCHEYSRSRGQDAISKMAAFRAGEYKLRSAIARPRSSVSISRFLINHGYMPKSTSLSTSKNSEGRDETPSSFKQRGHNDGLTDEVAVLRHEVAELHKMFQIAKVAHDTQNSIKDEELEPMPSDVVDDKTRVANLEKRVGRLAQMMHAMQHTSLPNVMDRLANLEKSMEGLECKAGDGYAAEVAKAREV